MSHPTHTGFGGSARNAASTGRSPTCRPAGGDPLDDGKQPSLDRDQAATGSASKQFTATAVLLLAQEGLLGLDDMIDTHLPGLPPWAGRITIAQLIHCRSSWPSACSHH